MCLAPKLKCHSRAVYKHKSGARCECTERTIRSSELPARFDETHKPTYTARDINVIRCTLLCKNSRRRGQLGLIPQAVPIITHNEIHTEFLILEQVSYTGLVVEPDLSSPVIWLQALVEDIRTYIQQGTAPCQKWTTQNSSLDERGSMVGHIHGRGM